MEALQALADPTRRQIIELLTDGELAAGEIAAEFDVTRPAVSQQLKVLRDRGLVQVRRDGRRRLYSLDPGPLAELDAWLDRYRVFWAQRLDALDTQIRRSRRQREEDG